MSKTANVNMESLLPKNLTLPGSCKQGNKTCQINNSIDTDTIFPLLQSWPFPGRLTAIFFHTDVGISVSAKRDELGDKVRQRLKGEAPDIRKASFCGLSIFTYQLVFH
jgi:hypothetical protein